MCVRLILSAFLLSLLLVPASAQEKEEPSFRGKTLTEWRKDLKDRNAEVRRGAALALAQMGKDATPGVPDLAAVMQKDEKANVRLAAATALWRLGPIAKAAAADVIQVYKDVNQEDEVRLMAAYALGKIGAVHKDVVPTLIDTLRTGSPGDKKVAILVLSQIGPDAKDAGSDLIKVYQNSAMDPENSRRAAEALKKIDPEAATKAGIK
jgi:HEAT repeat protein